MPKPSEIIEEIKADAAELQMKILSIPNIENESFSNRQSVALVDAQDGLSFWRRTHLEFLAKAFEGSYEKG